MPFLGAVDPTDLRAQARAELGLSRKLAQPRHVKPHPHEGGSSGYPDRRTTTTHDVVDGAIATRATTPAVLSGRECGGGRWSADVGRRTWCCRGRRAAASGFKREVTINMLLGGTCGKAWGGGGTASATAAVQNALAEALRRLSSQGWTFDVRVLSGWLASDIVR